MSVTGPKVLDGFWHRARGCPLSPFAPLRGTSAPCGSVGRSSCGMPRAALSCRRVPNGCLALPTSDAPALYTQACAMGVEGIVSKRETSRYRSGSSPDWLNAKNPASAAARREATEDWGARGRSRKLVPEQWGWIERATSWGSDLICIKPHGSPSPLLRLASKANGGYGEARRASPHCGGILR